MPPKPEARRKAMRAAAAGKSTLGMPRKIGGEYSKADNDGRLPKRVRHKGKGER